MVILPPAHLTSHSKTSGFRWVTTPLWLSGSLRPCLYSFSVYSYHLFLISSASVRSLPFQSFIVPILAWNVPLVSVILLKWSLVFPTLLFSSFFFFFLHCSLKKASFSRLAILFNFAFSWVYLSLSLLPFISFLFSDVCMASSDNHHAFFHFFFFGMVLVIAFCTVLQTSVHSSSDTLSDIICLFICSSIYLFLCPSILLCMYVVYRGLPWCLSCKEFTCNADDSSISGLRRSPGEENETHSSILASEIPGTDNWPATVHKITKNQTQVSS